MFSVGVCGTIKRIILRAITSSIKCNINLDFLVVKKTTFLFFPPQDVDHCSGPKKDGPNMEPHFWKDPSQNYNWREEQAVFCTFLSIEPIAYHSLKVLVELV